MLLRSKFNAKFVTKTLSFQLIRSGCTCFGHWNELWRPPSENTELVNVGFSRPPLQIYVPETKLLFSDCDVIFWTRQENKPEPWENCERFFWARSIRPKFPEISVQNSMDRFGPTGKVSKKLVSTYPTAGNCFQKTRCPAVRNFDQFSRNGSFNSSKNIRYLFRNVKRL